MLGSCDPASRGDTWNTMEEDIGPVRIVAQYGWDGVSTAPNCDGPLNSVQGVNTSATDTWYAHFLGRANTPHTLTLAPGFNKTYNSSQLGRQGFNSYSDLVDLIINKNPSNDPTIWAT